MSNLGKRSDIGNRCILCFFSSRFQNCTVAPYGRESYAGWEIQAIFAVLFSEGVVPPDSHSWREDIIKFEEEMRLLLVLSSPTWVLDFRCDTSFRNYSASKTKFKPNVALLGRDG